MRSIVTRLSSVSVVCRSVCRSLCHTSEPCKNGWTDRDTVWVEDSGGHREPCIRWGPGTPIGRGIFGNLGARRAHCTCKYRDFLLWAVCKIGRTDWFAVWIVDSGGPKEAQVQSYSPGGANVPTWEGTLAPPGGYDWTVRLRQQCGLMSNYFDHFLYSIPTLYFHCNRWPLGLYLFIPVAAYMYAVVILNTLCLLTCIHRVFSARLQSVLWQYSVGSSDCLDIRRQLYCFH